jgi:hypothetical protein
MVALFINEDVGTISESYATSINRDLVILIPQHSTVSRVENSVDPFLSVKRQPLPSVKQDQLCGILRELPISGAKQNSVPPAAPVPLPRGLEEFEELAHNGGFRRVCNDANHRQ